jgi:hypothetical protein
MEPVVGGSIAYILSSSCIIYYNIIVKPKDKEFFKVVIPGFIILYLLFVIVWECII